MNEHHLDDQLRAALDGAARGIDLDLEPADALARRGRGRRTRRRVLGGCAVGAIAIAGVTAITGGGDDSVQTADDGTSPSTLPLVVTEGDDTTTRDAGTEDAAVVTTPPTLPGTEAAVEVAAADVAAIGPIFGGGNALLPWKDGFLAFRTEYAPQPLGPLTDEQRALFPQEVSDLFPDGLPPTVDEAMSTLEEAGLMDLVWATIDEHPELQEAIFAVEPAPPTFVIEFTVDGETWTPVEADFPDLDGYPQYATAADGITVWAIEEPAYDEVGRAADDDGIRTLTIAYSDDLIDWRTATVDIEVDAPEEPYLRSDIWPSGIATDGERWVALVQRSEWIDSMALLPDDLRDAAFDGELDWSEGPDGIEIYDIGGDGGREPTTVLTWEELGVETDVFDPSRLGRPEPIAFTGDFAGVVQSAPIPEEMAYGNGIVAAGGAFYSAGDRAYTSTDGLTWTPIEALPTTWISAITPLDDGAVLFLGDHDSDGQRAWRVGADGDVTEVSMPELPLPYGIWSPSASAAFIVEASEQYEQNWDPVTIEVEHEGYGAVITNSPDGASYRVTDLATGTVVWSAEHTWDDDAEIIESLYEYDEETGVGALVFRDPDGAEIVRIPDSVLQAAYEAVLPSEPAEEAAWNPDLWLIATRNGTDWLTVDIAEPANGDGWYPYLAAVNGDRVLYQNADGWTLAQTPG